jgi:hypothetical protein
MSKYERSNIADTMKDICDMRLILTNGRYLTLCSERVQGGDFIGLILGFSKPLILRLGDNFLLIIGRDNGW